jgi:anti-sigma-K factor RskA
VNPANDPELDALLGAYALDALDDDERARVDAYIAANPGARDEVDELRESAASLALAPVDDVSAPSGLWDRISSEISSDQRDAVISIGSRRGRGTTWGVLAVAASIVVAVLVTSVVVHHGSSNAGNMSAAFNRAARQPGAQEIPLKHANGTEVARVVLLPDGTGYLKNESMQALPSDKTYQLWALSGDPSKPTAISAGVLGSDPNAVAFHLAGAPHGFGVTVEQTPGVAQSTQPMYATASVA